MNILGHAYIGSKVVLEYRDWAIIGALLPESFPFIENNPFSFEEIHEGGERLLRFLERNYPQKRNLGLGMLAHSANFGADGFNKEIENYGADKRGELLQAIAKISGVSLEVAKFRLHNFLWWGIDVWILKSDLRFVNEVGGIIKKVNIEEISKILGECFAKEFGAVERTLRILFQEIYRPEDLNSVEGLAQIWARQAAGLPEHDQVDVFGAAMLMRECANLLENNWRDILKMVEFEVGKKLQLFLEEKRKSI